MMLRKYIFLLSILVAIPSFVFAQDGKLRGKVKDKESGEALIGATVQIDGTSLGASTDVNGEYVVLSVPPGDYTIKVNFVGYAQYVVSGVRVNANMTTTRDFALSSSSVQMQDVVVVAERPLIQRNTTNTVRVSTSENIKNIPIRGIQNIVALEAGVVKQGDNLYVRGGRAGEIGYIVDGANVTSPISNSQTVGVIQEAIEEFQLQAGGFSAEFGGANAGSGIVRTTVKTGGQNFKISADYQTDGMKSSANSLGYNNAVLTLGGPLASNLTFFVAGQYNYTDNKQAIYLTPFEFKGFTTDALGSGRTEGQLLPNSTLNGTDSGVVSLKENTLPMNWEKNTLIQGTLLYDANPFKVRFTGSYNSSQNPNGGSWPSYLPNYFLDEKRFTMTDRNTLMGNLRLTHLLSSTTFYEVGLSYQNISAKTYDQDFEDEWLKYSDSSAHAGVYNFTDSLQKGYFINRYQGPYGYSTIFQFNFNHPYQPNNSYSLSNQTGIGGTFDLTSQVTNNLEVKFGGGFNNWVYRSWSISSISSLLLFRDANKDGVVDDQYNNYSEYERRIKGMRAGGISAIGYKWDDPTAENGEFDAKPGEPSFSNLYFQSKYESSDLIINFGMRYENFNPNGTKLKATVNPATGLVDYQNPTMDDTLQIVTGTESTSPYSFLLPRVSFSFPVSDNTVFYAMYGKYAQMPSLDKLFISDIDMSRLVNPTGRTPYNLFGTTLGFTMKPERNTQYEVGIRQTITDNFAFTVSGFYKDLRDQLQIRRVYNSLGVPITTSFQNQDFGTIKGLEVTLELRRTNRLAAKVNYTLSDARGTGSDERSSNNAVTDEATARFPNFIVPLNYNQTHRGSMLVDYRFGKGDGEMLEGFGVNAILSFNSGHPYTKIREPRNLGQASPWNIGVRSSIDTRSRNPIEPVNSSTTPWVFNLDLSASKMFYMEGFNLEVYANLLNALNIKQIINVHPSTGTATDDGWLKSPFAESYKDIPNYEDFYRAINLDNRYWALQARTFGGDVYGSPRQVRFGVRLEY